MYARASTAGAVGIGVSAETDVVQRVVRTRKGSRERSMMYELPWVEVLGKEPSMADRRRRPVLVERKMRVPHACLLEGSDDAVELRNVGNGADAHAVHFAAR